MPLRKEDVFFPAMPDLAALQGSPAAITENAGDSSGLPGVLGDDMSESGRRLAHERKIKQLQNYYS